MADCPDFSTYEAAMQEHGGHLVTVEMTLLQLTLLVGSLQLALRHPHYPENMRPSVTQFIADAIANVTRLSPVVAQVMEAGNDPMQDR